jgi:hypothetical protein
MTNTTPKDSSAAGQELPPLSELLTRFERQAHRAGELWERCQGKGWPPKESAEFTAIRDERLPALRKQIAALAQRDAGEVPVAQAFWVVERFEDGRSAGYWDGANSRSFQADIAAAVQFCRQQDATRATRGWHWTDTKVVEHAYIGTRPAPGGEPTGDNWQQYAKEGESAQQCIERHRSELNSFMTLYINKGKA